MLDFANIYPSVLNWAIVGIMAVTFIAVMKFITNRWPQFFPGVHDVVASI